MNTILINGSPKKGKSFSDYILQEVKQKLPAGTDIRQVKLEKPSQAVRMIPLLAECERLVFAFPTYTDGIPSHIIRVLEGMSKINAKLGKKTMIYFIIHCEFIEGKQTKLTIEMMEHWCRRAGYTWGQGLGVGGGEMLHQLKHVPMGTGPKTGLGEKYLSFCKNVVNLTSDRNLYVSPDFPRPIYLMAANSYWVAKAKYYGIDLKEFVNHPM